ncbi:MAG TPA: DUF305 domain-containing protein [Gemmatimonadaceae bacterium]|nr:DUF305 domain-containing protein [Gemmatimonadaceae bacterium]
MKNAHRVYVASRMAAGAVLMAACQASTRTEVSQAPAAAAADGHVHTPGMAMDIPRAMPAGARDSAMMHQMDPDTRFMHHMTVHHAQALAMVSLVPPRTTSQGLRLLAERIDISQKDEIALMRRWLERHGKPLPDTGQHAMHMTMPGILSEADMTRLSAATGVAFERLFLELMTRHHQGALTMVRELLGSQGAAQDSEVYRLVADIEADQRGEIARMQSMLNALGARPTG